MQYRDDPKSGHALPALGMGCMRFPRGVNMKVDAEKTEKLILSCLERGVNYFDAAYVYVGSEGALGEALHKNGVREKAFIATKLPHQQCKTYEDFDRLFTMQLERLRTDYIDYYLIHHLSSIGDWNRLQGIGVKKWIAEKKAGGQIKQIGFSYHGAQNEFASLLDAYGWDFCQIQYNYMNENYQAGRAGMLKAHEKGMPVIVMEPLLGGKLASGLPKRAAKLFTDADASRAPAEWAFRWLWNQPEVTVVLSGMGSDEQIAANAKIADATLPGSLTAEETALYPKVVSIIEETYKVPCTGCNYCMPCPNGVNIPECFAAYNSSYAMGFITGMTQYVTSNGMTHPGKNFGARSCVKCGVCEKKCPQHIPIMSSLGAVAKRMEPFYVNAALKLFFKLTK